jgi:hypothetical protein
MSITKTDAYSRHQKIVDYRNLAVSTFFELGRELYCFEKEEQFLELGYTSFNSYLADPDVDISRNLAFMLKRVYKTFLLGEPVQPVVLLRDVGHSKLDVIRPYVTEDNVEELVNVASTLSRSSLRAEMKSRFGEVGLNTCEVYENQKCPIYQGYKECKQWACGECPQMHEGE